MRYNAKDVNKATTLPINCGLYSVNSHSLFKDYGALLFVMGLCRIIDNMTYALTGHFVVCSRFLPKAMANIENALREKT